MFLVYRVRRGEEVECVNVVVRDLKAVCHACVGIKVFVNLERCV